MFTWFTPQHSKGILLSGPIITEQAVQNNWKVSGDPKFKANHDCLSKFKTYGSE